MFLPQQRPAVIVRRDDANRVLNRVQVVPLTSSVARVYASEALIYPGGRPHKVMADQIRTVAKELPGGYIATLTAADLVAVEQVIKLQLGLR